MSDEVIEVNRKPSGEFKSINAHEEVISDKGDFESLSTENLESESIRSREAPRSFEGFEISGQPAELDLRPLNGTTLENDIQTITIYIQEYRGSTGSQGIHMRFLDADEGEIDDDVYHYIRREWATSGSDMGGGSSGADSVRMSTENATVENRGFLKIEMKWSDGARPVVMWRGDTSRRDGDDNYTHGRAWINSNHTIDKLLFYQDDPDTDESVESIQGTQMVIPGGGEL